MRHTLGRLLVCVGERCITWGDALLPPAVHGASVDADRRWRCIMLRAAADLLDEEEAEREAAHAMAAAITRYPLED